MPAQCQNKGTVEGHSLFLVVVYLRIILTGANLEFLHEIV
jgi:hypothetical protein